MYTIGHDIRSLDEDRAGFFFECSRCVNDICKEQGFREREDSNSVHIICSTVHLQSQVCLQYRTTDVIISQIENRSTTSNFLSTTTRSLKIENFPSITDSKLNAFDNANSSTHSNSSDVGNNTIVLGPVLWTGRKTGIFIVSVCMMFLTISGNLLVILSVVLEKKLQTAFNYYIVNLACVDLNVACSDMVFFIIYSLYEYFPFNFTTCWYIYTLPHYHNWCWLYIFYLTYSYWIWNDWVMPFESAATLAAIGW